MAKKPVKKRVAAPLPSAPVADPSMAAMIPPEGVAPQAPVAPSGPGMKSGGSVGKASKRADGIAQKGKTKGRYI
jgi:hypothetical protein